jgi:uncharacterized protein (TIGR01777 family)
MRVLVTGGAGFIGKRLVSRLVSRGDEVIVLTRRPPVASKRVEAARILNWDPQSGPPTPDAFGAIDAVVNLHGESIANGRWTAAKKERIRRSRIDGTRHLVQGIAAASPRPRVLVTSSAVGYYGPRGDESLDESSPSGQDFLAGVCREWEAEGGRARELGVRVVTIRTGIVLGAGGGALAKMILPFQLFAGGPLGSGEQWMSWVHLDDECGIIMHALDRPSVEGPMNATSPNPVRNRDFARALGRVLGRPSLLPTPAFAMRLLLGEMADALLLTGQRVLPKKAEGTSYRFHHPLLGEALESILK